ncbi:uncharacterized protein LOC119443986 [Dermacentor silvarum]|uniref:uncharacterized protein LOC119443986 n=1 Tax=Dermacentor silvarum TaxID=543639 RepID=UPI0021008029|nr:uncharacterized protein LOC119443986 [Dermacentor silvarum]
MRLQRSSPLCSYEQRQYCPILQAVNLSSGENKGTALQSTPFSDELMTPTPVSLRCSDGQNERPVDKCWGIPVFAALSTLIITLPGSYMAVLFVFFVDDYNVSRERASWPQNSLTMATHVSGLLVAALQRRISVANIAILGALLASLGVIASAFAREVIWMSISLGVMYGLGIGMFMASCGYPYPYALRQVQGYRLDARIRCMGYIRSARPSIPHSFTGNICFGRHPTYDRRCPVARHSSEHASQKSSTCKHRNPEKYWSQDVPCGRGKRPSKRDPDKKSPNTNHQQQSALVA